MSDKAEIHTPAGGLLQQRFEVERRSQRQKRRTRVSYPHKKYPGEPANAEAGAERLRLFHAIND